MEATAIETERPATRHQQQTPRHDRCDLSVVAPVHNEEENLRELHRQLTDALAPTGLDYELILVDDGSTDTSLSILRELAQGDPRVTVLELRRNFGQTAAMAAGIDNTRGDVIVPIDADLQNDPADIPKLLEVLNGEPRYDIVSGWRKKRQDKLFSRRVPSIIANKIIRSLTNVPIHDFGCTLKAYRREVLEDVSLSSDLHRFLPALAAWHGAKITEMVANHRPRTAGVTKYGLWRTVRVVLDLIIVRFLGTYMTKPLYFFGRLGILSFGLALFVLGIAVAQKFGWFWQPDGLNLNRNILVSLSALMAFFTVQCVMFGILAELLVRVYHDRQGRRIYRIREVIRKGGDDSNS